MGTITTSPAIGNLFSRELANRYAEFQKLWELKKLPEKKQVEKPAPKVIPRDYTRRRAMGGEQEYGIIGFEWGITRESCDYFLENGGKLYLDCSHPEYASPEASNPLDAALYDKAGELITERNVYGSNVRLFKNNTDNNGNSYASHESYSIRTCNLNDLALATLPFFTTRIIFAASGRINNGKYELSQKAGHTSYSVSDSTTSSKGIFNTKNEPHTKDRDLMRLHVVSGDANLSEFALFLKYGTTALVLDLYEDRKINPLVLDDAISAFHLISKDLGFKERFQVHRNLSYVDPNNQDTLEQRARINLSERIFREKKSISDRYHATSDPELRNRLSREYNDYDYNNHPLIQEEVERLRKTTPTSGENLSAIEIQRYYLDSAEASYRGRDLMTNAVLDNWKLTLDLLEENPMHPILARRLDWVIEKNLIDTYMRKTGKTMNDSAVRNIDLQYHELGSRGLFNMLQRKGLIDRLLTDEKIEKAAKEPPKDTRAWIRGKATGLRLNVDWGFIILYNEAIYLNNPLHNYIELERQLRSGR